MATLLLFMLSPNDVVVSPWLMVIGLLVGALFAVASWLQRINPAYLPRKGYET